MDRQASIPPSHVARATDRTGGVLRVDADGHIRRADARACMMLGYGRGDLVGRPIEDLVPDPMRHAHREAFATSALLLWQRAQGVLLVAQRRDGSELPVEVSLGPALADGATTTVRLALAPSHRRAEMAAEALRREDALVALGASELEGLSTGEVIRIAVRVLAEGLGAERTSLLALHPGGALGLAAEHGPRPHPSPAATEPTRRLALALEDGTHVLDDPAPSFGAVGDELPHNGDGVVAVVRVDGEPFGLLCAHGAGHRGFGTPERAFLGAAAELLGEALAAAAYAAGSPALLGG
jgi:PAS domain S-box-containing protein